MGEIIFIVASAWLALSSLSLNRPKVDQEIVKTLGQYSRIALLTLASAICLLTTSADTNTATTITITTTTNRTPHWLIDHGLSLNQLFGLKPLDYKSHVRPRQSSALTCLYFYLYISLFIVLVFALLRCDLIKSHQFNATERRTAQLTNAISGLVRVGRGADSVRNVRTFYRLELTQTSGQIQTDFRTSSGH